MGEQLYRDEPIPRRSGTPAPRTPMSQGSGARPSARPAPRTPMNGSKPEAKQIIARIMADERLMRARFSSEPMSNGERQADPSLATAQTTSAADAHLPQRYREMRAISRWEQGEDGRNGRWLTEAELFYRQGKFMEDFEDDCPYQGVFKSYFPTYNAMSDRQLRGYFTWRAAVRHGVTEQASLSFAYVYLYELINGIGVADPLDGFRKIEGFWQAYRAFSPEIDRFASVWLQDYVVYHGLPAHLLEPYKTLTFDRALMALRQADEQSECAFEVEAKRHRKKDRASALPLPVHVALEEPLFRAIDALSTYHLAGSRFYKEHPDDLRHVACAVFVRMSAYHRKHRKGTLLESWFGEEVALPYTMFGSAVFFANERHADCIYELDEIHRYRCDRGYWTCERPHGSRSKNPKLGDTMRAVDRSLRDAFGFEHPLKETGKTPKYVQKFIDREVETWISWSRAHAPKRIEIDLSQLAGIRFAAEATRESLLIDEEREGEGGLMLDAADSLVEPQEELTIEPWTDGVAERQAETAEPEALTAAGLQAVEAQETIIADVPTTEPLRSDVPDAPDTANSPLTSNQLAYLRSLFDNDMPARSAAVQSAGMSEDMLVDAINEALFDLVGDTIIEYGAASPELIEDYRADVEGLIDHA